MDKGNYSISDIVKLIQSDSRIKHKGFLLGHYYSKGRIVHRYIGIRNKIIVYDPITYKPRFEYGIFYEFEIENGPTIFAINPNKKEWRRLNR